MTAYDIRISDWSSDVCSSDLPVVVVRADSDQRDGRRKRLVQPLGLVCAAVMAHLDDIRMADWPRGESPALRGLPQFAEPHRREASADGTAGAGRGEPSRTARRVGKGGDDACRYRCVVD